MYEELIKSLRTDHDKYFARDMEAEDVIAKLNKKRIGTWHRFKATQRSYFFVCNSCGSMYPYLTRCCPNCGVEYIDEEPPKEEK